MLAERLLTLAERLLRHDQSLLALTQWLLRLNGDTVTAQDFYTKLAIVDALCMIGDIRAVSPILKKEIWFEQASRHIGLSKSSVADALSMEITKIMAALVNICKNDIEPLLTYALKDRSVRAADVLEELGWQPSRDENGAIYYLLLSKWDKCVEIGEPAINPLIA